MAELVVGKSQHWDTMSIRLIYCKCKTQFNKKLLFNKYKVQCNSFYHIRRILSIDSICGKVYCICLFNASSSSHVIFIWSIRYPYHIIVYGGFNAHKILCKIITLHYSHILVQNLWINPQRDLISIYHPLLPFCRLEVLDESLHPWCFIPYNCNCLFN